MLLFENKEIDSDDRVAYRRTVTALAELFAAAAPARDWPLSSGTQMLFVQAGLWTPPPATLRDVLQDDLPRDDNG